MKKIILSSLLALCVAGTAFAGHGDRNSDGRGANVASIVINGVDGGQVTLTPVLNAKGDVRSWTATETGATTHTAPTAP